MKELTSLLGSAYRKSKRLYTHSTAEKNKPPPPEKAVVAHKDEADVTLSPFLRYYDGYLWPDLYTEVIEALEACALIYPLAEVRRLARRDNLQDSKLLLRLPLSHSQVLEAIESNEHEFLTTRFAENFYIDLLKTKSERSFRENDDLDSYTEYEDATATADPDVDERISIVAFGDEYENEELVYLVEVDHCRKRVTVCFRGSVNKADWATNLEIYMEEMPNPLRRFDRQAPKVKVHNGFYNYLFVPSTRGSTLPENPSPLSAYQEILQRVLPVLRWCSGYKLYVTGHSLGGALATLFAFRAATEADSRIPKPVTLISIASPYVGDQSFRTAHQLLEGWGKLRHLRVSSQKDLVPLHPKVSFRWQFYNSRSHVGSLFKHVGMNLRLLEEHGGVNFSYPKVMTTTAVDNSHPHGTIRSYVDSFLDELSRGWDQTWPGNFCWNPIDYLTWPSHRLRDYHRRLKSSRRRLSNLQLNDLYCRKRIVGDLEQGARASKPPRKTNTHVILLSAPTALAR